jgi:hypothetical protein
MEELLQLANNPVMWILSLLVVSVVVVQAIIFFTLAKKYVANTKIMTDDEVKTALKVGAIGTVGPALAVFTVAIILISTVGGPLTLSRVGIIGSAAFEQIAAYLGSGGTLGTEDFTPSLLSAAAWTMSIGGAGWMIGVFFLTKRVSQVAEKQRKSNPKVIMTIAVFAPLMIFFVFGTKEAIKAYNNTGNVSTILAFIFGGLTMFGVSKFAQQKNQFKWLKEWALGISIIVAMLVGSLVG